MKKKRRIALMLMLCTFSVGSTNVYAQTAYNNDTVYREVDSEALSESCQEDISIIKENGFSDEDIQDLSLNTIEEVADALEEDPKSVEISTEIYTFDELQNIEMVINLSEDELVSDCGLSRQKAKEIKNQVKLLENMSDKQIRDKYKLSNSEIAVFRKAFKKQKNFKPYKAINDDNKVTLSSTISSSKLSFTQVVLDQSTYKNGKRTNSKYKVTESFDWLKCYYPWSFTDTIGVAWSGGYAYTTSSKSITYYNMNGILPSFSWASTSKGTANATADGTPSVGCKYNFSQAYSSSASNHAYAKSGKIVLYLSQAGYSGKKAQVISKYCHKVLAVGSVSISSAPSISPSISTSYNSTDTDKTTKAIYY